MTESTDMTDFDRVDDTGTTEKYVRFLDEASGVAAIDAMKRRTFDLVAAEPGQVILETGCGTGEDARALASKVAPGGKVVGLDKSEEMIAEADRRFADTGLPLEFVVGDATDLEFESGSFDACRIERTLIHVPDATGAVRELVRVLRSGGRLVAFEADMGTFVVDSPHREVTRRILRFWCDGFQNAWIARHLPALFRECGLLRVYVEPVAVLFDFEFAHQVLVSGTLERAVEAGVVTSEEGERWVSGLEEARDAGVFFCANMGYIVAGETG